MKEFFAWAARMAEVQTPEDAAGSLPISERLRRVVSPSPLNWDRSVVRVVSTDHAVHATGTTPQALSVLVWPDLVGVTDMAHDQLLATQLGALITFALDRRVQVASTEQPLSMTGSSVTNFIPGQANDRELMGPLPAEPKSAFEDTARAVLGLRERDRGPIGAAIDLHYASTLLLDTDLNAAYALAVAGIETLSRHYNDLEFSWNDWDEAPHLDSVFAELELSVDQADRLRSELIEGRHLKLRQTFATYVADSLPDRFWELEMQDYLPTYSFAPDESTVFTGLDAAEQLRLDRFVPRDRSAFRRRLLATYDARSSYVHTGRRGVSESQTMATLAGSPGDETRRPLEYLVVRRILRTLAQHELARRSDDVPLPGLILLHEQPS
jgi:hypothetical protein